MSWVVTVGPRPGDLWGIGKDNLKTLAHPAPTGRSQHVFRQCPLDAEIVSRLNCYFFCYIRQRCGLVITRQLHPCLMLKCCQHAQHYFVVYIISKYDCWNKNTYTCATKLYTCAEILCNMLSTCSGNLRFNSIFQQINDKKLLHSYVFYVIRMLLCTL